MNFWVSQSLGKILSLLKAVKIFPPHSDSIIEFSGKVLFGCVCVIYRIELFGIICFRSEAVVWMGIYSMACRVNGNILVPHYNISRRWSMTRRHDGYKLFVFCSILSCQLEIGAIHGEYTAPSNWSLQMVLLGQHGCSISIIGVRDYGIERFHGIPSH